MFVHPCFTSDPHYEDRSNPFWCSPEFFSQRQGHAKHRDVTIGVTGTSTSWAPPRA